MVCVKGLSVLCRDFSCVSFAFCNNALALAGMCVRDTNSFLTDLGSAEVNILNCNVEADNQHNQ